MLPAMIPAMTARLGSPEFSAVLGNALGLFFANPGNLTVQANPIRPSATDRAHCGRVVITADPH